MDDAITAIASISNETFKYDESSRLQALAEARALVKRLSKPWKAPAAKSRKKCREAEGPILQEFPLFELPPELRLVVYKHALCTEPKLFITTPTAPNPYRAALLKVSHQVRREAISSFYGQTFIYVIFSHSQHLLPWLQNVGKKNCAMVKRLELRFSDVVYNMLASYQQPRSPSSPPSEKLTRLDGNADMPFKSTLPSSTEFARALLATGIGYDRVVYALRPSDRIGGSGALTWIREVEDEMQVVVGKEVKLYAREEVGEKD